MIRARSFFSYLSDSSRIYRVLPGNLRRGYWGIFLLQTLSACLESLTVVAMTFFFASLSSPDHSRERPAVQYALQILPDAWAERLRGDRAFIVASCLVLLFFIIVKNLANCFTISRTTLFSERLGLFISRETYARYFYKNYYWHLSPAASDVLLRLGNRGSLIGMATALLQFFGNIITSVLMLASAFYFEPALILILAVVYFLVGVGTYTGLRRSVDYSGRKLAEITAREHWAANMATRGIREIIINRKQDAFLENIVGAIRDGVSYKSFLSFSGFLPAWFLEIAGFATILCIMAVLAHMGRTVPEIIAAVSMLFLATWRILPAVSRAMGLTVAIRGARPMAVNCLELLDGFSQSDHEERTPPAPDFRFRRGIELRGVAFRYPVAEANCLHSLTLSFEKGATIGVVGASGSGKTTLGLVLAGLLEPREGEMLVDGLPLDSARREAFRGVVGYVPQNPLLLPGSIADNVALSRWGEPYDRERVTEACRLAAMDFVDDDPRGIDFPIGDGGLGLSGGQAQRVSIARAFFTRPQLLIFDEATSSLDQAGEKAITQSLKALQASGDGLLTTVTIAHRLTTVEHCDAVVWMEKGAIVKIGPPTEILPEYIASKQHETDNETELEKR